MTAVRSSGSVSPVYRTDTSHSTQAAWFHTQCFRHCHKRYCLQIRFRSAPGVWLLLGVVVVMVGIAVAIAGYVSSVPNTVGRRGSTHSERMKLIGPIVMGVGLFIFICAGTLLLENRDRENLHKQYQENHANINAGNYKEDTQRLDVPCQKQCDDIEQGESNVSSYTSSLSNVNLGPPLTFIIEPYDINASREEQRFVGDPPPLPGNGRGHGGEQTDGVEGQEEEGRPTLLTRVLHHQDPASTSSSPCPCPSPHSHCSDSWNSSENNFPARTRPPLTSLN